MTPTYEPTTAHDLKKGTSVFHEGAVWQVGKKREFGRIVILTNGAREKVIRGNTVVGRLTRIKL